MGGQGAHAHLADTVKVRRVVNGGTFGLREVEEMLVKVRRALQVSA